MHRTTSFKRLSSDVSIEKEKSVATSPTPISQALSPTNNVDSYVLVDIEAEALCFDIGAGVEIEIRPDLRDDSFKKKPTLEPESVSQVNPFLLVTMLAAANKQRMAANHMRGGVYFFAHPVIELTLGSGKHKSKALFL